MSTNSDERNVLHDWIDTEDYSNLNPHNDLKGIEWHLWVRESRMYLYINLIIREKTVAYMVKVGSLIGNEFSEEDRRKCQEAARQFIESYNGTMTYIFVPNNIIVNNNM